MKAERVFDCWNCRKSFRESDPHFTKGITAYCSEECVGLPNTKKPSEPAAHTLTQYRWGMNDYHNQIVEKTDGPFVLYASYADHASALQGQVQELAGMILMDSSYADDPYLAARNAFKESDAKVSLIREVDDLRRTAGSRGYRISQLEAGIEKLAQAYDGGEVPANISRSLRALLDQ